MQNYTGMTIHTQYLVIELKSTYPTAKNHENTKFSMFENGGLDSSKTQHISLVRTDISGIMYASKSY